MVYFALIKKAPSLLISVAAYWKSSNKEACAKTLLQILANNIDNRRMGLVSEFIWGHVCQNGWKISTKLQFSKVFFVHLSWKICELTLIIHKTFHFDKINAYKGSVVSKFQASIRRGIFALISHTLLNFVICQIMVVLQNH